MALYRRLSPIRPIDPSGVTRPRLQPDTRFQHFITIPNTITVIQHACYMSHAHKRPVESGYLIEAGRFDKHVSASEEFFGSVFIEYCTRICSTGQPERDSSKYISFNITSIWFTFIFFKKCKWWGNIGWYKSTFSFFNWQFFFPKRFCWSVGRSAFGGFIYNSIIY